MSQVNDTAILAPFEIWEVPFGDRTVKFHEPLVLTPTWMPHDSDEPGDVEYLEAVRSDLNIDVFADNRDDLLEIVVDEIRFIWEHIVLKPDNTLSRNAVNVKMNFLALDNSI